MVNPKKYTECGVVARKFTSGDMHHHKRSYSIDVNDYFDVRFPDGYRRVNVSTDTYHNKKEGDTVCFEKIIKQNMWIGVPLFLVSLLMVFVQFIGAIWLVGDSIIWLWEKLGKNEG